MSFFVFSSFFLLLLPSRSLLLLFSSSLHHNCSPKKLSYYRLIYKNINKSLPPVERLRDFRNKNLFIQHYFLKIV
jgi:hypothetical protein